MAFEIFKIEDDRITWLRSALTVKAAKAQMRIAASAGGEYMVLANTQYQRKRIFLVGYDSTLLKARAELFRRFGHDVMSALGNEEAIHALSSIHEVDLFVVGHKASEETRREMITWLRVNFPNAKIVSLNPGGERILNADFNVVCGKHDWLLLAAAAV